MDPSFAPVFGLAIVGFVVSIPLVGISLRIAAKPVVEALTRYREAQNVGRASDELLTLQDRRIGLLEAELQHVNTVLRQLTEAEEFRRQLESGAPGDPQRLSAPLGGRIPS
ncbi:MAG TPA: hypothetical protein VFQ45_14535 [Longimicrobium sp.]|nr:hypothetical protein [Longimicrobium sp.]